MGSRAVRVEVLEQGLLISAFSVGTPPGGAESLEGSSGMITALWCVILDRYCLPVSCSGLMVTRSLTSPRRPGSPVVMELMRGAIRLRVTLPY